jgi:Fibronectin type III domain
MIATAVRPLLAGAAMVLALAVPSVAAAADTQPPTAPSGVRVTDTTVSTASLAWNPSTDDSGSVSAYRVFELVWDPNAFEYQEQQRVATSGLSATVPNLLPDHSYLFVVRAVDGAGNVSAASNIANGDTDADGGAPTTPANIRTTNVSFTTATVAWEPSTDDVGVVGYWLSVDGGTPAFVTGETSATVRQLDPGRSHTIAVSARDSIGNFSGSSTVTFTTLVDSEAPTAPTNLQGTVSGIDGFFRWQAATDNSGEARYELYLDDSTTPFARADFGRTEVTLFPLELPPGTHQVTARARDRAGNLSRPSNAVTITV